MKLALVLFFISSIGLASVNGHQKNVKKLPIDKMSLSEVLKTDGVVWSFVFIDQNQLLYTKRDGVLTHFNLKTKKKTKLNIPNVHVSGQGGLLDVQYYHYKKVNYIYVTFSEMVAGIATTSLARSPLSFSKGKPIQGKWQTIFRAKVKGDSSRHFGSRLVRKGDHIFMGIGDRAERNLAQDKTLHNGSIIRLSMDGSHELWSYGHRNPQGIDMDPVSGELYSCEFGPRGGDELNMVVKGENYGWPVITYGKEYWGPKIGSTHKKGMQQPVMYWTPSISPSGMVFYTGDKIKKWRNNLFLANLSSRHLRRLVLKEGKVVHQEILLSSLKERIRHVRNGPNGYLYFSTDSGKVIKIESVQ